jgi:hypothetical protein
VVGFAWLKPGFELGSSHVGFVLDKATLRQVSSEYFGFLCHLFIPLIAPQSSPSVTQSWYNKLVNGLNKSGFGSTPDH